MRFTRAISLPASAMACALLLCAVPGHALAQQLPDAYPDAVPAAPPRWCLVRAGRAGDPRAEPDAATGDDCARGTRPAALPASDPRAVDPLAPNPLRGQRWYVDPREPAWRSYVGYRRRGQRAEGCWMWRVAREPRFRWFGRWTGPDTRSNVRTYLRCVAAVQPGAVPLMVVMRHQGTRLLARLHGRRCGRGRSLRAPGTTSFAARRRRRSPCRDRLRAQRSGTPSALHRRGKQLPGSTPNIAYGVDVLSLAPAERDDLPRAASLTGSRPAARTAKQLRYIGISKVRGSCST